MIVNNFLPLPPPKGKLIRNSGVEDLFSINSCFTSDFCEKGSFNFPLWRGIEGEDTPEISLIKDRII